MLETSDEALREILLSATTIAIVGHSPKPERPSYQIAQYLRQTGYQIYPINPGHTTIDGHRCYASLRDLPDSIDIVNVFRRSEYLPEILETAFNIRAKTLWTQLGISHPQATTMAQEQPIHLIMDRCIKIEHRRLLG